MKHYSFPKTKYCLIANNNKKMIQKYLGFIHEQLDVSDFGTQRSPTQNKDCYVFRAL
jgi:hypothetical protein